MSAESKPKKSSGGLFTGLLWLGATALLGLGLALPFADKLSWTFVRIGRTLESLGIQPGVLFLAGAIFVALALVVHAVRSTSRQTTEATERMAFLTDELMTQMALVRSGQNAGQNMQEELRQGLARLGAEVTGGQGVEKDSSSDAIFRLAASVDQLNARVDDRIEALVARIGSGDAVSSMPAMVGDQPAAPVASAAPAAPAAPVASDPYAETNFDEPVVAKTAAPAVGNTPFNEPETVEPVVEKNPFSESVDLDHQPAMEFLDLMEESTEGRPHKASELSLDMGGAEDLGMPLDLDSVKGLDDITFGDEDFDSRRSA